MTSDREGPLQAPWKTGLVGLLLVSLGSWAMYSFAVSTGEQSGWIVVGFALGIALGVALGLASYRRWRSTGTKSSNGGVSTGSMLGGVGLVLILGRVAPELGWGLAVCLVVALGSALTVSAWLVARQLR